MSSPQLRHTFAGSWAESVRAQVAVPGRWTTEGVSLQSLAAGTALIVRTRHNRYRLVVLDGPARRVRITGGSIFPESTDVRVAGATAGGSAVKVGWIAEGFLLELSTSFGPVTTSRVEAVTIEGEATVAD